MRKGTYIEARCSCDAFFTADTDKTSLKQVFVDDEAVQRMQKHGQENPDHVLNVMFRFKNVTWDEFVSAVQ